VSSSVTLCAYVLLLLTAAHRTSLLGRVRIALCVSVFLQFHTTYSPSLLIALFRIFAVLLLLRRTYSLPGELLHNQCILGGFALVFVILSCGVFLRTLHTLPLSYNISVCVHRPGSFYIEVLTWVFSALLLLLSCEVFFFYFRDLFNVFFFHKRGVLSFLLHICETFIIAKFLFCRSFMTSSALQNACIFLAITSIVLVICFKTSTAQCLFD
jgi:hypothetical protein